MTICIAALAQYTQDSPEKAAIICVADKAVTWDGSIQWESDTSKIVVLSPSGSPLLLQSGSEDSTSRMIRKLSSLPAELTADDAIDQCERLYKQCYAELVAINIFDQGQMTREEYIAAISGPKINEHIEKIAKDVYGYDMDCDLLVCGFGSQSPFVVHITSPGLATNMTSSGFEAIGSGSDRATPRILWSNYKKSNPIEQTLYDLFDAKANAEMNVGVGYRWDATIAFKHGSVPVPDKVKALIERAWNDHSYGPFEKREKDDLGRAPANWKSQLRAWVRSISSSEPSPPSSQSASADEKTGSSL